jgi:hypothetical protein
MIDFYSCSVSRPRIRSIASTRCRKISRRSGASASAIAGRCLIGAVIVSQRVGNDRGPALTRVTPPLRF